MAFDYTLASTETYLNELKLSLALQTEGVYYAQDLFNDLSAEEYYLKRNSIWDAQKKIFYKFNAPFEVVLEDGIETFLHYNVNALFVAKKDETGFGIYYLGTRLSSFTIPKRPEFTKNKFDDENETPYDDIAYSFGLNSEDKSIVISYSDECAVKDKGETCLFCCYNRKRDTDDQPLWKSPTQIATVVKAAYEDGFKHLTVTGGFIPERREVDYYLDVAEAIQNAIGVENFHGTACIGAPLDLSIIEKYKEAGFETIAFNTEVWGKDWFGVYCKGKVSECGGYDHWLEAIRYAVDVFGKGKVRSQFVAGLQPKSLLLEGIETQASWGVVTYASPWRPGYGSPLEGHRSPNADWHFDVLLKNYKILKNNGITFEDVFYSSPNRHYLHELFKIFDGKEYDDSIRTSIRSVEEWNEAGRLL